MRYLPVLALALAAVSCQAPPRDGWELRFDVDSAAAPAAVRPEDFTQRVLNVCRFRLNDAGFDDLELSLRPNGQLAVYVPIARAGLIPRVQEMLRAEERLEMRAVNPNVVDRVKAAREAPDGRLFHGHRLLPQPDYGGAQLPHVLVNYADPPIVSTPDVIRVDAARNATAIGLRIFLQPEGSERFREFLRSRDVGRFALLLNDRVLFTAQAYSEWRFRDSLTFWLGFSQRETLRLASRLNAATLPPAVVLAGRERILPPEEEGAGGREPEGER